MTDQVQTDAGEPAVMRAALDLHEVTGWSIVPAHFVRADGKCSCPDSGCESQGKHPRFKQWAQRTLKDEAAIRAHWSKYPHDNFGIATGQVSGVVVLDVDGAAGEASLAKHGPLPQCAQVITARGRHLYFAAGSVPLHNTQGARGRGLGKGLDLRATGGFVICPPSVHATGHVYQWAEGLHVGVVGLVELPSWIVEATCERTHAPSDSGDAFPGGAKRCGASRGMAAQGAANQGSYQSEPRSVPAVRAERWADAALRHEVASVRSSKEGERNAVLNTAAFNLGTVVGGGALDGATVRAALLTAAWHCGLPETEAKKTIDSGLRAGRSKNTRSAPSRDLPGSNGHSETRATPTRDSVSFEGEPEGPSGADVQPAAPEPSRMTPRHNTAALFAPLPAQRWAVPGLQLGPGRPTLIVGYGASAKTWGGQAIAIAAAAGRPIWDHFECSPMVVLHIDYEQGFYATCKRYQRLALGMGLDVSELGNRLHYVEMPRVYLDQKGGEDEFIRACEGVDLVILDALRGAAPFSDENDSAFRSVVDSLTHCSQRTGSSVIALHHAGKPKGRDQTPDARAVARGTSAIFDAAGCVLNFVALPGGAKLVSQVKMPAEAEGHALPPFELVVEDVEIGGNRTAGARVIWQQHTPPDEGAKAAEDFERHAQLVLRAVRRVPEGQSANAVVARCGVQRGRALDVLRALTDEGRLECFKGARGSKFFRVREGDEA